MRTRPATAAEVDTWLTVLSSCGQLHRAETAPGNCWIVQRRPQDRPWTLHHPILAMDWIEDLLRAIRSNDPGTDK